MLLWLKRSRRYFPIIEAALKENGLPDDLKYLAVAESALRPHVGSPRGAVGFWQFMPETARRFGLRVDRSMDDRRSIIKSTAAAVRYLATLYEDLEGWALAAAAFNMGEEGLKAEILAQGLTDYYRLYLPLETQRYLFRVVSVKLIFQSPERYGFLLGENDYYPPLSFEPIDVECPEETPLTVVAQAAGTDFKRLKDLNPEIRGHYLEKGRHQIFGPAGSTSGFEGRFRVAFKAWIRDRQERIYVVQAGDSLSTIADQFEVPLPALLIWNRIDASKPIHPGDRLVIYRGAGGIR